MNSVAAIGANYCAVEPTTLVMEEREKAFFTLSTSRATFNIKDARSGQIVFLIEGKGGSLQGKKIMLDGDGNEIAVFAEKLKLLSIHFAVPRGDEKLMTITNKMAFMKYKMVAEIKNLCIDGRAMRIKAVGDWRNKTFVISEEGGGILATISRKSLMKLTYYLEINPGVDSAMIVLLALAFAELEQGAMEKAA
eukprot:CAMPEP_0172423946 /NCGR_PEP_ID=MMETSP1064-20121228/19666_1 /TAXON_ID=202472 /ORGANISM="Aulacoseira subarctica , Strain CCAP 1002/5" /LENGTH=192 /DNA_ID=CAMNT_0013165575 /DNA_START=108 /DNA_END=686 /DNA_ORIENTATION=+